MFGSKALHKAQNNHDPMTQHNNMVLCVGGRGVVILREDGLITGHIQDRVLLEAMCRKYRRIYNIAFAYKPGDGEYDRLRRRYDFGLAADNLHYVLLRAGSTAFANKVLHLISGFKMTRAIYRSDAVVVFMPSTTGLMMTLLGFVLRTPLILYYGSDWANSNLLTYRQVEQNEHVSVDLKMPLRRIFQGLSYRMASLLLFRDRGLAEAMRLKGRQAAYIPGNTQFNLSAMWRKKELNLRKRTIVLLSVGNILPRKGFHDGIKAVAQLLAKGIDVRYTIAGSRNEENVNYLMQLAHDRRVSDRIEFKGFVASPEDLRDIYRAADLFLLPSYHEGFPRAVYEAMSQGLPVIASRIDGLKHTFVHRQHVLFIRPGHPEDIADEVLTLVHDQALYRDLIQNGHRAVAKELASPSASVVIDQWLQT